MTADQLDVHPDEGTIHAWLDSALGADEAARIEAHVAACEECASRVAEARGLIAGSSRILGLLDARPEPLIKPAVVPAVAASGSSLWRTLRVTPARAAIAAVLLVAVGITLTRDRVAEESQASTSQLVDTAVIASAPAAAAGAAEGAAAERRSDTLLQSAVARKLAVEQPPRAVRPVPGTAGMASADMRAEKASAPAALNANVAVSSCWRIESTDGTTTWAGVALPLEVSLSDSVVSAATEPVPRYAITDPTGRTVRGSWSADAADVRSLVIRDGGQTITGVLESAPGDRTGTLTVSTSERDRVAAGAAARESRSGAARTVRVLAKPVHCSR